MLEALTILHQSIIKDNMAYRTVEVEVYLSDFDTDDLLDELKSRGVNVPEDERILDLYDAYVLKQERFDKLLRDYFYETIGRIA